MKQNFNPYNSNFKIYFEKYYAALNVYGLNFIDDKDIVEDIVQEVFVSIWEREKEFESEDFFKNYLYSSVKFGCMNHLRHMSVRKKTEVDLKEEHIFDNTIDKRMIKEEVYRMLLQHIDDLPENTKKVYKLSLKGLKQSEIAQDMGITIEAVKSHKKKAKKLLREKLGRLTYLLIMLGF